MTRLTTMTERELLQAAHDYLLMRWDAERAKAERMAAQGENAPIATYRRDKYRSQLDEIESLMQETDG